MTLPISPSAGPRVIRQFIDGPFGQIHVRTATPETQSHRPLACLHMSPKSGRIFAGFMKAAATDRTVIAHDYPGFGESEAPPEEPHVTIEDYAASLWTVVDTLGLGQIDLFGYHTGSEVAVEAARQRPESVGSIVLISTPIFTDAELQEVTDTYHHIPLDLEGTRFQKMWKAVVAHRGPGMTLEMMADTFAENLRAGEKYEWGHRAAFAYAKRYPEVLRSLPHRITVINPNDDLNTQTLRAPAYLTNGVVEDHPEWGHGFLDAHTADAVRAVKAAVA
tara:strand:- start:248578 stop:249408 length:831 start_codon:yes stop_codon:yes gene_type:complete